MLDGWEESKTRLIQTVLILGLTQNSNYQTDKFTSEDGADRKLTAQDFDQLLLWLLLKFWWIIVNLVMLKIKFFQRFDSIWIGYLAIGPQTDVIYGKKSEVQTFSGIEQAMFTP